MILTLIRKTSSKFCVPLWFGLFIFGFSVFSVGAPQLPLEHFIRKNDYMNIVISPDGKHYATRVRDDNAVYMIIVRLSDGEVVGGIRPGKDNEVAGMRWVTDERLVYTFAEKNRRRDSAGYTGELYAVNIDNKKNKMLAGYRASDEQTGRRLHSKESEPATHRVLNVLPKESRKILIVEHPWSIRGGSWYDVRVRPPVISKLDIFTGKKSGKETIPFPGASIFADDEGNVNFITWRDTNSTLHASFRESKEAPWKDVSELFNGSLKNLTAEGVNRDGSKVYLYGNYASDKAGTLYEFDLKTKKLSRLFDNVLDIQRWELDINKEPYVAMTYPGKVKYHYANNKVGHKSILIHQSLVKAFGGQTMSISSQTRNGDKLTVRVDSDVNPGEYYSYDTNTKKADFLWANYSWIDPRQMANKKTIQLDARDGLQLNGYLTFPKDSNADEKLPLVVVPHGGPHGVRDHFDFDYEPQLLANRGYAVLQINFRGSGGYTEAFEKLGYSEWGGKMVDDVIDATQWVIDQGFADKNRVCVFGASYGGYSALMSVAKAPDLFKCAIGYVGVYDLPAMFTKGDIPLSFSGKGYLRKVLGSDMEALAADSPVNLAGKVKANVMLIHGDKDDRVPSVHAKRMRKALEAESKSVVWLYLGDAGHGAGSLKNKTKVYTGLLEFLNNNIGVQQSQGDVK